MVFSTIRNLISDRSYVLSATERRYREEAARLGRIHLTTRYCGHSKSELLGHWKRVKALLPAGSANLCAELSRHPDAIPENEWLGIIERKRYPVAHGDFLTHDVGHLIRIGAMHDALWQLMVGVASQVLERARAQHPLLPRLRPFPFSFLNQRKERTEQVSQALHLAGLRVSRDDRTILVDSVHRYLVDLHFATRDLDAFGEVGWFLDKSELKRLRLQADELAGRYNLPAVQWKDGVDDYLGIVRAQHLR